MKIWIKKIVEILYGRKLINDNQNSDLTYYNLSQYTKNYGNKTLITIGDYYSILHNNYLGRKLFKFKSNCKIRILNGYENINFFNEMCGNCVVDVSDNFKINDENPLYFRLFIVNKNLTEKSSKNELIQKGTHQFIELNWLICHKILLK